MPIDKQTQMQFRRLLRVIRARAQEYMEQAERERRSAAPSPMDLGCDRDEFPSYQPEATVASLVHQSTRRWMHGQLSSGLVRVHPRSAHLIHTPRFRVLYHPNVEKKMKHSTVYTPSRQLQALLDAGDLTRAAWIVLGVWEMSHGCRPTHVFPQFSEHAKPAFSYRVECPEGAARHFLRRGRNQGRVTNRVHSPHHQRLKVDCFTMNCENEPDGIETVASAATMAAKGYTLGDEVMKGSKEKRDASRAGGNTAAGSSEPASTAVPPPPPRRSTRERKSVATPVPAKRKPKSKPKKSAAPAPKKAPRKTAAKKVAPKKTAPRKRKPKAKAPPKQTARKPKAAPKPKAKAPPKQMARKPKPAPKPKAKAAPKPSAKARKAPETAAAPAAPVSVRTERKACATSPAPITITIPAAADKRRQAADVSQDITTPAETREAGTDAETPHQRLTIVIPARGKKRKAAEPEPENVSGVAGRRRSGSARSDALAKPM